uniref:Ammonium_transp domain-containing protein n=1 Tax=Meloidogyne hapla TaxID=6305 RepID=A0A1I8BWK8_MELHA
MSFATTTSTIVSVVHLVGGVSGLAATLYLKPRQARFGERGSAHMSK